jgi:hypothetical protein
MVARQNAVDGDALTHRHSRDVGPDLDHDSGELVAEPPTHSDAGMHPLERVNVRAAQRVAHHFDDDLAGSSARGGDLLHRQLTSPGQDCGTHVSRGSTREP